VVLRGGEERVTGKPLKGGKHRLPFSALALGVADDKEPPTGGIIFGKKPVVPNLTFSNTP
jgi:hypothetical protein